MPNRAAAEERVSCERVEYKIENCLDVNNTVCKGTLATGLKEEAGSTASGFFWSLHSLPLEALIMQSGGS